MPLTSNLEHVARQVFDPEYQGVIESLIHDNKTDEAIIQLLGAVDRLYEDGELPFETAAEYYHLLDVPPERASKFRQLHARAQ